MLIALHSPLLFQGLTNMTRHMLPLGALSESERHQYWVMACIFFVTPWYAQMKSSTAN